MIEKIATVKNPLTVIAMFAAIAEISGAAVLPFIAEKHQGVYIWFLMLFPLMLIVAFFLTLNFNHGVLYAPSDYKDEKNFLKSFVRQTPDERIKRLAEAVSDASVSFEKKSTDSSIKYSITDSDPIKPSNIARKQHSEIRSRYALAEQLVFSKLAGEFNTPIEREVRFYPKDYKIPGAPGATVSVMFDGVTSRDNTVTAIEVKYFPAGAVNVGGLVGVFSMAEGVALTLKDESRKFKLVLVAVIENDASIVPEEVKRTISDLARRNDFEIDVRVYRFDDLESSLGLD